MKLIILIISNLVLGSLLTVHTTRVVRQFQTSGSAEISVGGKVIKPTSSPTPTTELDPTPTLPVSPSPSPTPALPTASPTTIQVQAVSPSPVPTSTPTPTPPALPVTEKISSHYRTEANRIVKPDGSIKIFKGVNRPSLEWSQEGEQISTDDYGRMKSWGFNLVRLPLNQKFWLESADYRKRVETNVAMISGQNMDVILDLHWSDKGVAGGEASQQRMADSRSVEFWRQVASQYKDNPRVLFELYNEPRDISAEVWLNGGDSGDGFTAVGMQQLTDVIRNEVGAENLIIVNGLVWGFDHQPLARVRGKNIVYGTHVYGEYEGKKTATDWDKGFGFLGTEYPVIATEFGDSSDCSGSFSARFIDYLQNKNFSWTAWAWYPGGCGFPSVISDWDGTPSDVGQIIKQKLGS